MHYSLPREPTLPLPLPPSKLMGYILQRADVHTDVLIDIHRSPGGTVAIVVEIVCGSRIDVEVVDRASVP